MSSAANVPPGQPSAPQPAYLPAPGSILFPPTELYSRIASTATTPSAREPLTTLTIPPRSGAAWHVPAGSVFRLSTPEGPQVGDLNIWSAANPRERFWASRTRQLHASHVSIGDRLWSCLPYMRPLCGIVADTLGREGRGRWGDAKGTSRWGGRCHDLLGTRCDPYVNKMLTGRTYNYHCHSNLVRAVLPHGLNESDVHDVLNVFQVTGLNERGQYFMEASPAQPDDYIEFFAEQDLLCALSTCPGGDLSEWGWVGVKEGEGLLDEAEESRRMRKTCRPINVEVWRIADEVKENVLKGWEPPNMSNYSGKHGLGVPMGEGKA
ncbi:uncharacterized protein K452DRAFT_297049 [Aplosporella prunicola CBS 121167]|uniref:DUF1989 domain-containing protein n=1 Tax=Aplosporella prunicola CBS 121167 TaxID=1176127 RepID=A0A6A6BL38_9PEZI|nr:uncharacterized protein K452DRAFT_297049 [Aplosporella prunicola CBS 121167]KAF2143291.1 hypothetical protein K452DRAFT_297049 [Aplosporella prunicola CBS 121167]